MIVCVCVKEREKEREKHRNVKQGQVTGERQKNRESLFESFSMTKFTLAYWQLANSKVVAG